MLRFLIFFLLSQIVAEKNNIFFSPWHYTCVNSLCKKARTTPDIKEPLSLDVCQLTCGYYGALWPAPTGNVSLGNKTVHINPDKISLNGIDSGSSAGKLVEKNIDNLKVHLKKVGGNYVKIGGIAVKIYILGLIDQEDVKNTLQTKEEYSLSINQKLKKMINVTIKAENYFVIRNALATLSQLIVFDEFHNKIQIVSYVSIEDSPVYPYRGILLDTSRNFIDKATILRTIEGMGMSKLNTFHWHITDSHSFPYVSKTLPNMSKYGAYSQKKIYSPDDIKEIVEFGLLHGVRIIPELDAPAHVGEGWQWVEEEVLICFNSHPWHQFCLEPPCGQLNPACDKVYNILENVYGDILKDFQPEIFHMGGDEVSVNCWNSSKTLTDWMTTVKEWDPYYKDSFINLWEMFQEKAYDTLTKANGGKNMPVILWSSDLTAERKLDASKYIIQVTERKEDLSLSWLINQNLTMIFSSYDMLYLDCGFSAWVGDDTNWCAPYKGWQRIYKYSLSELMESQGYESKKNLCIGGEAALWSEQVDSTSVDSRIWPRAAALAERLWGEPKSSWIHAEQRMLRHRERLVSRGIFADSLEPEWCLQNQGICNTDNFIGDILMNKLFSQFLYSIALIFLIVVSIYTIREYLVYLRFLLFFMIFFKNIIRKIIRGIYNYIY